MQIQWIALLRARTMNILRLGEKKRGRELGESKKKNIRKSWTECFNRLIETWNWKTNSKSGIINVHFTNVYFEIYVWVERILEILYICMSIRPRLLYYTLAHSSWIFGRMNHNVGTRTYAFHSNHQTHKTILLLESVRLNRIILSIISILCLLLFGFNFPFIFFWRCIFSSFSFPLRLWLLLPFVSVPMTTYSFGRPSPTHIVPHSQQLRAFFGELFGGVQFNREAVRQRKALSRTSSNILLNSVQMGHNTHSFNQYHHINYNNHPSDCDLNSKLKDLKEESSQHSFSNIEVIQFCRLFCCQFIISFDQTMFR